MGICVHEAAAIKKLDGWMAEDGGPQTIVEYARKIREGWWSKSYVDAIGQPYLSTRDWPLHQVAMFAWIHTEICLGSIAQIDIGLGTSPAPDRAREANAAALGHLPAPFTAEVDQKQNNADCDGQLRWSTPVIADLIRGEDQANGLVMGATTLEPRTVPLEIGTTLASRTALHLIQGGSVARWSFDSDAVRVLVWVAEPPTARWARSLDVESLRDEQPLPQETMEP